jgi:superfamily II DNA/RNA helicase
MKNIVCKILVNQQITDPVDRFPVITKDQCSLIADLTNQLPYTEDAFLHRNGRTARMNAKGTAYLIIADDEKYPFLKADIETESLKGVFALPKDSAWQTLYIAAGKKDKVNKIDIVGLLIKKGGLQKEDVGLIEVKDQASYVAVKRKLVGKVLSKLANERIKNKKVKIEVAM